MSLKLSELHHNKIVFLPRIEFNLLVAFGTKTDGQAKILDRVLQRVASKELKEVKPCMNVPIRVWELKTLFPNYETNPPIWWERNK